MRYRNALTLYNYKTIQNKLTNIIKNTSLKFHSEKLKHELFKRKMA